MSSQLLFKQAVSTSQANSCTFSKNELATFVRLAREAGSGIGKPFRQSGSLGPLYECLQGKPNREAIATELRLLASIGDPIYASKAIKYKDAVYYIERLSLLEHMCISVRPKASVAFKFLRTTNAHQASRLEWMEFTNAQGQKKLTAKVEGLQIAKADYKQLDMTVEDYMLKHRQGTRLYLVHVGKHDDCMEQRYDGRTCVEHLQSVLALGAKLGMHLAILRDPIHKDSPPISPGEAVFQRIKDHVGMYSPGKVVVLNGGSGHSGYADSSFTDWVNQDNVTGIVVMGYDGAVCVHANVFGSTQCLQETAALGTHGAPTLLPALVCDKNIITSRPLLLSGGTLSKVESGWGQLQFIASQ